MEPTRSRPSVFDVRLRPVLSILVLALVLVLPAMNVSPQSAFKQEPASRSSSSAVTSSVAKLDNGPPLPPGFPEPKLGETGVGLMHYIGWQTYEPDGDYAGLTYDIYEGTDPNPPLLKANHTWCCDGVGAFNQPVPLPSMTTIYWRVVARDSQGGEASSPVWYFTTGPNTPPKTPHNPLPPDNAPAYSSSSVDLQWDSGDTDDHPLVYDIYFGTDPEPPLVASSQPGHPYITDPNELWDRTETYPAGPFAIGTRYYWRVVARDPEGAESSGPVWTFVAAENQPPVFANEVTPADGTTSPLFTQVSWSASDPNLNALKYNVYFGTTDPPAPAAQDLTAPSYKPAQLLTGTTYYWYVVASDGGFQVTSPTHSFTTVPPGDVNLDGLITAADAACALNVIVVSYPACTWNEGIGRADANCDNAITPADARCIHKSVVDGSCTICSGGTAPTYPCTTCPFPAPASPPVLACKAWMEWKTLRVQLQVSNLPSLKSFEFSVESSPYLGGPTLIKRDATDSFYLLGSAGRVYPAFTKCLVAGYTLGEIDCSSETEFVELDFHIESRTFDWIKLSDFVDDLAGASDLTIYVNEVPVLFSSFTATSRARGVQVAWKLRSDEAMESYTLFRHEGASGPPVRIANAPVQEAEGSYVDTSVTPGKTYGYELLVRTTDGDEFRSPVATVSLPALTLALHQNAPNPFNPQTSIGYDLPSAGHVTLIIFDTAGRHVRTLVDEHQLAGSRAAIWNGRDDAGNTVSSGVYFCVLEAGKQRLTRKLVLLK